MDFGNITKNLNYKIMFGFSTAAPAALPEIDFVDPYSLAQALYKGKSIDNMTGNIFTCYIKDMYTISLIIFSHGYRCHEIRQFAYQETSKNNGKNDAVLFIVEQ